MKKILSMMLTLSFIVQLAYGADQKKQELTTEKKNLLSRLVADYKKTWQLYKKRKAGKASHEELMRHKERMDMIKKTAIKAGLIVALTAATVGMAVTLAKAVTETVAYNLVAAAEQGDKNQVETLLISGKPADVVREAISVAVKKGHTEVVEVLLRKGRFPPTEVVSSYALDSAIYLNHGGIVRLLLDYGFKSDQTLGFAIVQQDVDLVKKLLESGENPSEERFFRIPFAHPHNWTYNEWYCPLLIAIDVDSEPIVAVFIQHGVELNKECQRYTPLALAAWRNNYNIAQMLINAGATAFGDSLYFAVQNNNENLVKMLLEQSSAQRFVNRQREGVSMGAGQTPLHVAAARNNKPMVEMLLEHGADPSVKDRAGHLPEALTANASINNLLHEKRQPTWEYPQAR